MGCPEADLLFLTLAENTKCTNTLKLYATISATLQEKKNCLEYKMRDQKAILLRTREPIHYKPVESVGLSVATLWSDERPDTVILPKEEPLIINWSSLKDKQVTGSVCILQTGD